MVRDFRNVKKGVGGARPGRPSSANARRAHSEAAIGAFGNGHLPKGQIDSGKKYVGLVSQPSKDFELALTTALKEVDAYMEEHKNNPGFELTDKQGKLVKTFLSGLFGKAKTDGDSILATEIGMLIRMPQPHSPMIVLKIIGLQAGFAAIGYGDDGKQKGTQVIKG